MRHRKKIFTAICITSVSSFAHGAITQWETASQAIGTNVTTSTNGGVGYTLAGAGIDYDYGDLSNGNIGTTGPGGAIEFIFNVSDTGASIALGGANGWNGTERMEFKLEQWSNTGKFGVTFPGDYTFDSSSSTFDVDTHVVYNVRADGLMELYVNGVSQGTSTRNTPGAWVLTGGAGKIGSTRGGGDVATGMMFGVASYDGELSSSDISGLYSAYSAVPEPSSTALLGLGGIALILRRRK